ncbi:Protein of unknown function [Gryllus bimaculatus]|nr:Protein of unknown function [Gryllus bimaculatus]
MAPRGAQQRPAQSGPRRTVRGDRPAGGRAGVAGGRAAPGRRPARPAGSGAGAHGAERSGAKAKAVGRGEAGRRGWRAGGERREAGAVGPAAPYRERRPPVRHRRLREGAGSGRGAGREESRAGQRGGRRPRCAPLGPAPPRATPLYINAARRVGRSHSLARPAVSRAPARRPSVSVPVREQPTCSHNPSTPILERAMKVCALVLALCAGALSMPVGVEEGPRPVVPLVITDYSSVAKDAAPAAPVPAAAAAEPAVQQPVVPAAPAAAAAAAPAEGAVRTEQPAEPAKDAPLADNKPAPAAAAAEEDKLKLSSALCENATYPLFPNSTEAVLVVSDVMSMGSEPFSIFGRGFWVERRARSEIPNAISVSSKRRTVQSTSVLERFISKGTEILEFNRSFQLKFKTNIILNFIQLMKNSKSVNNRHLEKQYSYYY